MSPVHQVWPKPSCMAQWKGKKNKTRQTEEEVGRQHQGVDRLEFTKSQKAVENMEKWRKLVVKSSVVPQGSSQLMKKLSRTQLGAYQKTLMLEESVQSWYMEWQQHLQLPKQLLERTENFKTKPWEWWQVPRKQHPSENWKLLQDIQLWKTDKTSRCWHRQPNSRGFIATPCLQGWASQQKGDSRDPATSTRAGFLRRETPNC